MAAVVLVIQLALGGMYQLARDQVGANLRAILGASAQGLEAHLERCRDQARSLASTPQVREWTDSLASLAGRPEALAASPAQDALGTRLGALRSVEVYTGFFLLDPQLRVLASDRRTRLGRTTSRAGTPEQLRRVLAGNSLVLPPPPEANPTGASGPCILVASPVRGADGLVKAALVLCFDLPRLFAQLAQTSRRGESGETYLCDQQGRLLSRSRFGDQLRALGLLGPGESEVASVALRELPHRADTATRHDNPLTRAARHTQRQEDGEDLDGYLGYLGHRVVGAWNWNPRLGLGLITEMSEDEAYHSFFVARRILLAMVAILGLIGLGFTATIYRGRQKALDLAAHLAREVAEREAAVLALAARKLRYAQAVRAGRSAVWEVDLNGGLLLDCDPELEEMLGYPRGGLRLSLEALLALVHPQQRREIDRMFAGLREGRLHRLDQEMRVARADGSYLWLWMRAQVEPGGLVGTRRLLGTATDITQRKLDQEEISRLAQFPAENPNPVLRISAHGRVLYANRAASHLSRYWENGWVPESLRPKIREVMGSGIPLETELAVAERLYYLVLAPVGGSESVYLHGQDITQRHRFEEQLKLWGKVIENSLQGVMVCDHEAKVQLVNPAFTRITGYEPLEVIGQDAHFLRVDRIEPEQYENMWQALTEEGHWSGEVWNRRKDGAAYPEWLSIHRLSDAQGSTTHFVAMAHDMTEVKEREERVRYLAHHDPLTGLPNRTLFFDRLELALARARRHHLCLAVLFLDLDDFKKVNDTFGHDAGDQLLRKAALRILHCLRDQDTVARLGGDEFVVIAEEIGSAGEAMAVATRIIQQLGRPVDLSGGLATVGCSVGVALYPQDAEDAETLLALADRAMYQAKGQGKNHYHVWSDPEQAPACALGPQASALPANPPA